MGRTHGALAGHNSVETLAQWLESLRQRSGLSWSQVAQTADETGLLVSQSTLFRAAQGERLPKWKTVQAFARVCGGDVREARRLWTSADRHEAARTRGARRIVVLPPQFITEPWQLVHAMNHLRRENGNPTLREMEEKAVVQGVSFLPRSTVDAVLRGRMPAKALLLNFVRYCGDVPDHQLQHWAHAWERVNAYRKGEARPAMREVQHELARVENELKHTRERLEQATAELTRTTRAARTGPTVAVFPPRKAVGPVPPPPQPESAHVAGSPRMKPGGNWWREPRAKSQAWYAISPTGAT
ncbi:hypothetical protein GCM10022403_034910 [Streptomyces coacervatus]|uniref:Helix-turn-helix domain-containing protein n=1 Tax=Streptomyces coacervatus TaxID=647381 RepID=A0ABP7HPI3_9ACTN|nr:helix-turn-helix transcriptional regulator [Streptomyces coacervatus]MDF2272038.1 helix-turn-helix transcriptional regulator [Streptomyces coacervatus]